MTDEALRSTASKEIKHHVPEVPDVPKKGVFFKDITPLLEDEITSYAPVDGVSLATQSTRYHRVLSADARGFIFEGTLANRANKGPILARKPDKLPRKTFSASYELEYVPNALVVHANSIPAGCHVLVVDDLLAPGGTAGDMSQLVEGSGGLNGRELLAPYEVASPLTFDE